MPKGKPYHEKKGKTAEKKETKKKEMVKKPPFHSGKKVAV